MDSAKPYFIRQNYTYYLFENGYGKTLEAVVDECNRLQVSSTRFQFVLDLLRNSSVEENVRDRCDGPTPSMALFILEAKQQRAEASQIRINLLRGMR